MVLVVPLESPLATCHTVQPPCLTTLRTIWSDLAQSWQSPLPDYCLLCASIVYCLHSGKLIKSFCHIVFRFCIIQIYSIQLFQLPIITEYCYHCFILQQLLIFFFELRRAFLFYQYSIWVWQRESNPHHSTAYLALQHTELRTSPTELRLSPYWATIVTLTELWQSSRTIIYSSCTSVIWFCNARFFCSVISALNNLIMFNYFGNCSFFW